MDSENNSPTKVESLSINIIIHSLQIVSKYTKYKVQVQCTKNLKKETIKMKKNPDTDVVFFESSLTLYVKFFNEKPHDLKITVFEFIDGVPRKNGYTKLKSSDFEEKTLEFKDLHLNSCSDESGIICISINCSKKLVPFLSFSDRTASQSIVDNELEENDVNQSSSSSSHDPSENIENKGIAEEEKTCEKSPPTSLQDAGANSQSKTQALEQCECKSELGPGQKHCNCCRVF